MVGPARVGPMLFLRCDSLVGQLRFSAAMLGLSDDVACECCSYGAE